MPVALNVPEKPLWTVSSPLHNRLSLEDRPVHAWYRFVLSFPPHLVRQYFETFGLKRGQTVLDPFCGTGTTLVEAKKHGIVSQGIEANPMAALASRTKTDWTPKPSQILSEASRIAGVARSRMLRDGLPEPKMELCKLREQPPLYGLLDFDADQRSLILDNSISPLPLHRVLVLKELIGASNEHVRAVLRLALAWTVVNEAGNLKFGPEVGITAPKFDVDVIGFWLAQVERMAHDLLTYGPYADCPASVHLNDSRIGPTQIAEQSIDVVFTSPPYPNEKDYTRTTRLESVVLDLIKCRADLRQLKKSLIRSNTRNVYADDTDDDFVTDVPEIQRIARDIEFRRTELGKTSGFERLYHRVAKHYFGGMARHFRELRPFLKPGAVLGYVVGDQASYLRVMIRTGQLLAEIAEREGYVVERIDLFRTRHATATKDQLREEVVVLRWPGA